MNIKKKLFLIAASALISIMCIPLNSSGIETHTIRMLGYNGEPIAAITVPDGGTPDLSSFEESDQLNYFESERTQVGFGQWDKSVVNVKQDMVLRALSIKMTIENSGTPTKTAYYSKKGRINISGLNVTITKSTQVPDEKKKNGIRTDVEVIDISKGCSTYPETLDEAFKNGNSAKIQVIPPAGNKPIYTYDITLLYRNFGDANGDGVVNAVDASWILVYYSKSSTGGTIELSEEDKKKCDVNMDEVIDSSDASDILKYYSADQTSNGAASWDELFNIP